GEEEKNGDDNATTGDNIEKTDESDAEMPLKEAEKENEAENETKNKPIKSDEKELTQAEEEEAIEAPNSQPMTYFVILDIKEDEKRPFILGTSFLTTAKAVIKFDKGTITLRSGKSKMSFHRIHESLCKIKKGIKNDIEPIAPTMTVNRLVLEWEERIKLHQEKEMELDQWRSKTFKNKHPALVKVESK
ncbi:hypothetical protein Tco_1321983, partial [Tanacetum coccineum]